MQTIEKGDLVRIPRTVTGVNIWRVDELQENGQCLLENGTFSTIEKVKDLELISKSKPLPIFGVKAHPLQTICVGDIVSLGKGYYEVQNVEESLVEDDYALIISNGESPLGRYSKEVHLVVSVKNRLDSVGIQYTKQFDLELGDVVKVLEKSKYRKIGKIDGYTNSERNNIRVNLGQHSNWISKKDLLLVAKKKEIYDTPLVAEDIITNVYENDLVISQNNIIYEVIGEEHDDCIAARRGLSGTHTLTPKTLTLLIRAEDRLDLLQPPKEEKNMPNPQDKDEMLRKQQVKINELTRENEEYRQKDKENANLKIELASVKEDYNSLHETSQQRINKLNDKALKIEQTSKEEIERLEEELANQKHQYELSLGYKDEAYDILEKRFHELEIHNSAINHELEKQRDINKYKQVIIDNQREIIGRLED